MVPEGRRRRFPQTMICLFMCNGAAHGHNNHRGEVLGACLAKDRKGTLMHNSLSNFIINPPSPLCRDKHVFLRILLGVGGQVCAVWFRRWPDLFGCIANSSGCSFTVTSGADGARTPHSMPTLTCCQLFPKKTSLGEFQNFTGKILLTQCEEIVFEHCHE